MLRAAAVIIMILGAEIVRKPVSRHVLRAYLVCDQKNYMIQQKRHIPFWPERMLQT